MNVENGCSYKRPRVPTNVCTCLPAQTRGLNRAGLIALCQDDFFLRRMSAVGRAAGIPFSNAAARELDDSLAQRAN